MSAPFPFELVSPEKLVLSESVLSVQVPGAEGDFEVLKDHAPVMASLRPGFLNVRTAGGTKRYFVDGGFADVTPTGLTVLANNAIAIEELNAARATQEIAAAESALAKAANDVDTFNASQKLSALKALQA